MWWRALVMVVLVGMPMALVQCPGAQPMPVHNRKWVGRFVEWAPDGRALIVWNDENLVLYTIAPECVVTLDGEIVTTHDLCEGDNLEFIEIGDTRQIVHIRVVRKKFH